MGNHVNQNLELMFDKMEDFISTKTVVGETITVGDIVLIPLIEVSVGLGAGGSQGEEKSAKDSGGGGLGAKIIPSAILAVIHGNVQLINVKNQDAVSKLIDMAPGIASKLNFGAVFSKRKKEEEKQDEQKEEIKFEEEVILED